MICNWMKSSSISTFVQFCDIVVYFSCHKSLPRLQQQQKYEIRVIISIREDRTVFSFQFKIVF